MARFLAYRRRRRIDPVETTAFNAHCAAVIMSGDGEDGFMRHRPLSLHRIRQHVIPIVEGGGKLNDVYIKPLSVGNPGAAVSWALSALCDLGFVNRWCSRSWYELTDAGKTWIDSHETQYDAYAAALVMMFERNRLRGAEHRERERQKLINARHAAWRLSIEKIRAQNQAQEAEKLAKKADQRAIAAEEKVADAASALVPISVEVDGIKTTGTPEQCADFIRRYKSTCPC